eukprot:10646285-Lingulodinium_polyedra.AAC.1
MLAGSCTHGAALVQRQRCGVGGPLERAASTPLILVRRSPGGVSTSLAGVALRRCSSSRPCSRP